MISLLRDIFEAVGLNLYLFPYGVLPTGAGRGIIEVCSNSFAFLNPNVNCVFYYFFLLITGSAKYKKQKSNG